MGSQGLRPETLEERIIYWTIAGTWGIWALGGLYLVGSVLGYALLAIVVARVLGLIETKPGYLKAVPLTVSLWICGMLMMAVALVFAHINFDLGFGSTTKSLFGWLKGWALMGVFPLIGAMVPVRPRIIYRAISILATQTLLFAPLFYVAQKINLPSILYVSPLQSVLGANSMFFDVSFYSVDEVTGGIRWRFYAPWSTAMAFLTGLTLIFMLQERSWRWHVLAVASTVVVCYMAGSRLSIVALPAVLLSILVLSNLSRPVVWGAVAIFGTIGILLFYDMGLAYEDAIDRFNSARAASSRVRAALGNIAVHRWMTEAPIFGHGILERGGHVVELMPIGSHHTWWGLLFVKGAVGFAALAIPMAVSTVSLIARAQKDRVARAGLGVIFSMVLFSFGDNLEIIAYIFWPALVLLGIALRRPLRLPMAYGRRAERPRNIELAYERWVASRA